MPTDSSSEGTSTPSNNPSAPRAERKSALNDAHRSRWRRGQWIAFGSAIVATVLILLGLYAPLGPGADADAPGDTRETITLDDVDTTPAASDTVSGSSGSRATVDSSR